MISGAHQLSTLNEVSKGMASCMLSSVNDFVCTIRIDMLSVLLQSGSQELCSPLRGRAMPALLSAAFFILCLWLPGAMTIQSYFLQGGTSGQKGIPCSSAFLKYSHKADTIWLFISIT